MPKSEMHIETKLIHSGEPAPRINGAVSIPVFQSATFEYHGESGYHDLRYIRLNNTPNHIALHKKLAALESEIKDIGENTENAESALVTASGMAAISTAILTVLATGDHILAQDCLYGGTYDFIVRDLPAFGISFDFISGNDPGSWKEKLRPTTRAVFVETMTIS